MSFGIYEITLQYFSPQGTKHVNEMKIEVFCDLEIHCRCEKVTQELLIVQAFVQTYLCSKLVTTPLSTEQQLLFKKDN